MALDMNPYSGRRTYPDPDAFKGKNYGSNKKKDAELLAKLQGLLCDSALVPRQYCNELLLVLIKLSSSLILMSR